ncbi:MAG: SAM-dependent methyltransferase [Oscillospiraceae bacterium]|nr:SAM-dependent methyltransferase [Oscillospiraceae bacterium]
MNISAGAGFIGWLGKGEGLLEYDGDFAGFSELIKEKRPIFIRHIFPSEYKIPYKDIENTEIGGIIFVRDFINRMDRKLNFSVQIRAAGDAGYYKPAEIKHKVSDYFKSKGFTEDKRYPGQIITIFISNGFARAGLSRPEENLSAWSGGMRHYAVREDTISRAGFKLMEALEAYPGVLNNIEKNGYALDLGAAPGGWTKVLLDNGLRVTAVDPVGLAPALQANENVVYYNIKAHEYLKKSNKKFDLIVNDMSMNIITSVNFMLSLKSRLKDKGYIIITFKLTKYDRINKIKEGVNLLSRDFSVVFIKQLFHNRSEVTVILQKINNK